MSTKGFSRRDLLRLGGNVVLTVGAAKIVVTLPGCSGNDSPRIDASTTPMDAPITPIDAYDYGYATLDDCHKIGTYHYSLSYPPASTYHMYWTNAYGCPNYVYTPANLYCYPDIPDFAPGYAYFCFTGHYYNITTP